VYPSVATTATGAPAIGIDAERPLVGEFGLRVARAGRMERRVLAFAPAALAVVGVAAVLLGTAR
jgi:hypothetical protein